MKQDLTCFLSGGPVSMRWLLLESLEYIEKVVDLYPRAHLTVVTEWEEAATLAELPAWILSGILGIAAGESCPFQRIVLMLFWQKNC